MKTDRTDGETLIRTLMAWMRSEPRVCSMVRVPTVEDEDRRRIGRERKALIVERSMHVNRSKGCSSVSGSEVMSRRVVIDASNWNSCGPVMVNRCLHISSRRSVVSWIGSNC